MEESSSYDYTYYDLSRLTQSLLTFDSLDYEYDVASNMTTKSATLGSTLDFENTYAYDYLNRLTSLTQTGQMGGNTVADKHVTFAYNDASQRIDVLRYADDYANGANLVIDTSYGYDLMGRLTQIDHTDGTSTIHKFDFTYATNIGNDNVATSSGSAPDNGKQLSVISAAQLLQAPTKPLNDYLRALSKDLIVVRDAGPKDAQVKMPLRQHLNQNDCD